MKESYQELKAKLYMYQWLCQFSNDNIAMWTKNQLLCIVLIYLVLTVTCLLKKIFLLQQHFKYCASLMGGLFFEYIFSLQCLLFKLMGVLSPFIVILSLIVKSLSNPQQ